MAFLAADKLKNYAEFNNLLFIFYYQNSHWRLFFG